jgi:CBS domain-containing protein
MKLRVRDVMTADPVVVSPEATLREIAELLSSRHISAVPILGAAGRVVGVVSASDIIDFVADEPGVPTLRDAPRQWGELIGEENESTEEPDEDSSGENGSYFVDFWADTGAGLMERFSTVDGPEWNVLEEHTATEVMTRRLLSISPEAPIDEAAQAMLDHSVHRLLVMEDGSLCGVVTSSDLLRVLAGEA